MPQGTQPGIEIALAVLDRPHLGLRKAASTLLAIADRQMLAKGHSASKLCTVVGANIRKLRVDRGLSQEELAHRAGIDRSYLSEVENGHKSIGVVMLDHIAAALEVEVTDLFKGYKRPKSRRSR